ncbi:MAG: lipase family alpha/beta hydrolase, partial [Myxococcales bacterium]
LEDLRGVSRLAVAATKGIADLVEAMQVEIGSGPEVLGRPLAIPAQALARLACGNVRGVTSLVGAGIDFALARCVPLLRDSSPGPAREAMLAALNGVVGDHLQATGNPLAIEMRLRHGGKPLELNRPALRATFPAASAKVLVLVHGSSLSDLGWARKGHDHGASLARDLGCTPVYLHYNSGLHISTNGGAFAGLLETLIGEWPVPVEELSIVGHSMGGLVARSACDAAASAGHRWLPKLRNLVCLGTPHHGAPFERAGNLVDVVLGISAYSAPFARLGKIRSAGVTDLRHGYVRDEDWQGRDRFQHGADGRRPLPLPQGVRCFAAAATKAKVENGAPASDGLVPIDSALGRHPRPELTLAFPLEHQWIGPAMNHVDLLSRPEVYDVLRRWLLGGAEA